MAPQTAASRLALAIIARNGDACGGEDNVVSAVRALAKLDRGRKYSTGELRDVLCSSMVPLVRYAQECCDENALAAFDPAEFGDLCFDLLAQVMSHTRMKRNFEPVLDTEDEWRRVCRSLAKMLARPLGAGGSDFRRQPRAGSVGAATDSWYLSRVAMSSWYGLAAGAILYWVTPLVETGRERFDSVLFALSLCFLGFTWFRRGPAYFHLPSFGCCERRRLTFHVPDGDDDGDREIYDDSSHAETSGTEAGSPGTSAPASPDVKRLHEELSSLRK